MWHLLIFWVSHSSHPERRVEPLFLQLPESSDETRGVWFELALDGIVLLDNELKVSRFLSQTRRLITDGAVRRMSSYGVPYWVHEDLPVEEKHRSSQNEK